MSHHYSPTPQLSLGEEAGNAVNNNSPRYAARRYFTAALALAGLLAATAASAAEITSTTLADLSLEELASLQVTSVTKSPKPISQAAASVYMITEREIHRSGATILPEALRLAPNLHVARVDARNYAITARGFNGAFANKLLVMIDGRSIYSPLFSGVFWDTHDVVLNDLNRIEVISGPGGTLWGANAVNGVINIITKSAADTQGGLVSLGASANETHAAARYGSTLPGGGHYRVYGKHNRLDDTRRTSGSASETGGHNSRLGFRSDWGHGADELMVQGEAYSGRFLQIDTNDVEVAGGHLLARASRELSDASTVSLQAYLEHRQRDYPLRFAQHLNIADIELQHEWHHERHTLVWGGGYRFAADRITNRAGVAFLPADKNMQWRNVFVQDGVALAQDWHLTAGVKLEENPYTGWEALPSAQLAWSPAENRLIWAGASRAVRSPSRIDRDYYLPGIPVIVDGEEDYALAGGPAVESEVARVLELGYRQQPTANLSYSATVFYSRFDRLRTLEYTDEPQEPEQEGYRTMVFRNSAEADSYGLELWGSWQAAPQWRLHGGVVLQRFDMRLTNDGEDVSANTALATGDAEIFWQLRSLYDVNEQVAWDFTLRHVDELENLDLPFYTELDMRLSWQVLPQLELSLLGQNLLDSRHPEFGSPTERNEYERAVYGKLLWTL